MLYLKRNLSAAERAARIATGGGLALLTYAYAPGPAYLLAGYVVSATLAGTAAIGFCPACAMLRRKPRA